MRLDRVHPTPPRPGAEETDIDDLADELLHEPARSRGALARRGTLPPARDIERFRPGRFSLSGPLMHVFISYRVASERAAADELWEALARLGKPGGAYTIPAGARGKACPFVKSGKEGGQCKVFLDRHCLLDGRDWEAGFVLALAHSLVVVPLLSWEAADGGSVGNLVSLGEADREDNVLLEFILALALRGCEHSSVHAIFPILLGPRREDGSFGEFPTRMSGGARCSPPCSPRPLLSSSTSLFRLATGLTMVLQTQASFPSKICRGCPQTRRSSPTRAPRKSYVCSTCRTQSFTR